MRANVDYPMPRVFLYLSSREKKNYNNTVIDKMAENLQEYNFRGLVSMIFYYNDEIYEKRSRENIYEAIENSTNDVTGENVFIYDNSIEY